eukprot:TRINITY_DN2408_c0_g1_i1.p1 TRINITY_DN2408_c0_g1~~TRINITY_DN2408_c0_g1_i1.p1  ORF type:complete len:984 (+),score=122.95 TRINITY_DN2408_c0_g1_i1:75-2954(+)
MQAGEGGFSMRLSVCTCLAFVYCIAMLLLPLAFWVTEGTVPTADWDADPPVFVGVFGKPESDSKAPTVPATLRSASQVLATASTPSAALYRSAVDRLLPRTAADATRDDPAAQGNPPSTPAALTVRELSGAGKTVMRYDPSTGKLLVTLVRSHVRTDTPHVPHVCIVEQFTADASAIVTPATATCPSSEEARKPVSVHGSWVRVGAAQLPGQCVQVSASADRKSIAVVYETARRGESRPRLAVRTYLMRSAEQLVEASGKWPGALAGTSDWRDARSCDALGEARCFDVVMSDGSALVAVSWIASDTCLAYTRTEDAVEFRTLCFQYEERHGSLKTQYRPAAVGGRRTSATLMVSQIGVPAGSPYCGGTEDCQPLVRVSLELSTHGTGVLAYDILWHSELADEHPVNASYAPRPCAVATLGMAGSDGLVTKFAKYADFQPFLDSAYGSAKGRVVSVPSGANGCQSSDFDAIRAEHEASPQESLIVLVPRGGCLFRNKTTHAAEAGASGVLIYNEAGGALFPGVHDANVTCPVFAMSGWAGRAVLASIPSNGSLFVEISHLRVNASAPEEADLCEQASPPCAHGDDLSAMYWNRAAVFAREGTPGTLSGLRLRQDFTRTPDGSTIVFSIHRDSAIALDAASATGTDKPVSLMNLRQTRALHKAVLSVNPIAADVATEESEERVSNPVQVSVSESGEHFSVVTGNGVIVFARLTEAESRRAEALNEAGAAGGVPSVLNWRELVSVLQESDRTADFSAVKSEEEDTVQVEPSEEDAPARAEDTEQEDFSVVKSEEEDTVRAAEATGNEAQEPAAPPAPPAPQLPARTRWKTAWALRVDSQDLRELRAPLDSTMAAGSDGVTVLLVLHDGGVVTSYSLVPGCGGGASSEDGAGTPLRALQALVAENYSAAAVLFWLLVLSAWDQVLSVPRRLDRAARAQRRRAGSPRRGGGGLGLPGDMFVMDE